MENLQLRAHGARRAVRGRAENTCGEAHLVAMGCERPDWRPDGVALPQIVGRYRARFRLALMVRRAAAMQMGADLPNCSVRGDIAVVAPLSSSDSGPYRRRELFVHVCRFALLSFISDSSSPAAIF